MHRLRPADVISTSYIAEPIIRLEGQGSKHLPTLLSVFDSIPQVSVINNNMTTVTAMIGRKTIILEPVPGTEICYLLLVFSAFSRHTVQLARLLKLQIYNSYRDRSNVMSSVVY